MAITYIGSSNVSAYDLDGTFVVSKPASTAQGDVMFTMVNTFNGAPSSVPTGWSLAKNQNNSSPSLGTYVYWKVAGSSEPSTYSWGLDPGSDLAANIAMHTYRGVDTTTPVGASVSAVSTTAESLASGNVSVTTPGSWLLAVSGCRHTGTSSCSCSMSSMTEQVDVSSADTAGSFSRSMATYDSNGAVAVGTYSRTAVVTGTTAAHTVILLAIRPTLDLAETLTDNFDDNSIDTNKWTNGGGNFTAGVTESNGQIRITDVVGGASLKGLGSKVPYDLRESYIQSQIVSVFTDPTSILYPVRISRTSASDSVNYATIDVFNGNVRIVTSNWGVVSQQTYSATDHKFVRIRESSGTVYFDRSPDGVNWTNMDSQTITELAFEADEVWLSIQHFNGSMVTTSSTAAVDNFNIVPVLNTVSKTDGEDLSDSATTAVQRPRSTSDTETLADTASAALGRNRSASDGEDLSDSVSVARGLNRDTTDAEELADSLTSVRGYNRSASDTLGLSDSVSVAVDRVATYSDGLGLSDDADAELESGAQDFVFDGEDGLGLSDSVTASQGFVREAADAEDLSDSIATQAGYDRSAADALSLSDTAVAGLSVPRSAEDSESLSDSHTAVFDRASSATDELGLSDSLSVSMDYVVTATDGVRLSDTIHANGGADIAVEDDLGLSDSLTRAAEYERPATEALGLADSLSTALGASRSAMDALNLSESATAALGVSRSATDGVGLSDSVTVSLHRNIEVSDSVDLSDQTEIDQEFAEIVSDLEDLSDSVGWSLSLVVGDTVGLSDSATTNGGLRLLERTDVLTLSDSVTAGLYRTTFEPLERKASVGTAERVSRTEGIERKWSIGNES